MGESATSESEQGGSQLLAPHFLGVAAGASLGALLLALCFRYFMPLPVAVHVQPGNKA